MKQSIRDAIFEFIMWECYTHWKKGFEYTIMCRNAFEPRERAGNWCINHIQCVLKVINLLLHH